MAGWRTLTILKGTRIALKDECLFLEEGEMIRPVLIPLEQLRQVLIATTAVTITSAVLAELAARHVSVLICGQKHTPVGLIHSVGQYHEAAGVVMDQIAWKEQDKDMVWGEIVRMKLRNQKALLDSLDLFPSPKFREYMNDVAPGDSTNREAMAARMYFNSLFGRDFRRHRADNTNAILNYGYTILCSAFTRILEMHGCHTGLGIHHYSRDNPVNLSCDMMEPFRPLVDRIAYEHQDEELSWDLKKILIGIPNQYCSLNGKRMQVDVATEQFALETLKAVQEGSDNLPEVCFE